MSNNNIPKKEIVSSLANLIEDILDCDIDNYEEPFVDLGLASLDIPFFIQKVTDEFGIDVEVSSIFDYSNIESYSNYIYEKIHGKNTEENEKKIDVLTREEVIKKDKVAIIGMSCRFPGGASDPDEFWNLLESNKSAIREVPEERWDIDKYYSKNRKNLVRCIQKKVDF